VNASYYADITAAICAEMSSDSRIQITANSSFSILTSTQIGGRYTDP